MGRILSSKPGTDNEFPANCAGNPCLAPVCGAFLASLPPKRLSTLRGSESAYFHVHPLVIRAAFEQLGIAVSVRDVFIQGVPVEIDLLVPRPMARPKHGLIYEPLDVLAAFEVKNAGAFPGTVESVRKSFKLIRSANSRIYCAYITLAERKGYKWAATTKNLGADGYTLFWHNGSIKHRSYEKTSDWDRLTKKLLRN